MPVVGVLIILFGLFSMVLPFVGPLFGFGMGPDPAWVLTEARMFRHLIPGAAIVVGGIMLLPSVRASRVIGAVLAVLGGIWVTIAPVVLGRLDEGTPTLLEMARPLTYHFGTGLIITGLAAFALGVASGKFVVERRVRTVEPAGRPPADTERERELERQRARERDEADART